MKRMVAVAGVAESTRTFQPWRRAASSAIHWLTHAVKVDDDTYGPRNESVAASTTVRRCLGVTLRSRETIRPPFTPFKLVSLSGAPDAPPTDAPADAPAESE